MGEGDKTMKQKGHHEACTEAAYEPASMVIYGKRGGGSTKNSGKKKKNQQKKKSECSICLKRGGGSQHVGGRIRQRKFLKGVRKKLFH